MTVVGTLFTGFLMVWVTWRYVGLTKSIAESTARQVAASVQPVAEIGIAPELFGEGVNHGVTTYDIGGPFSVRNRGNGPLKIKHLYVVVEREAPLRLIREKSELPRYQNQVLMPGEVLDDRYFVETAKRVVSVRELTLGMILECTDLSELGVHTFSYHPAGGIRHSFSPPVEPSLRNKVETAMRRMEKWGEWDGSMPPWWMDKGEASTREPEV